MIELSPRHAAAAAALLLLAALPVWLHALDQPVRDDCADASAFFDAARIAGAEVSPVVLTGGAVRGAEGELARPGAVPLSVRVLRTFVPTHFYVRPTAHAFKRDLYVEGDRLRMVEAGADRLPVHWRGEAFSDRFVFEGYFLAQGGRPVRHPLLSGLALAMQQLVDGTRPVTLFLVSGGGLERDEEIVLGDAEAWLARAWREFDAACSP